MRITISDFTNGEKYVFNAKKITLVSKSSVIFSIPVEEIGFKTLFHYQKIGIVREFQPIFDDYLVTVDAYLVTENSID